MPRRGPKLSLCSWRAARGWPSRPEIFELLRLQVEDGDLIVLFGRREVQRVAHAGVDRDAVRQPPVVLDEVLLEVRAVPDLVLLQVDRELLHLAEQEAGERRAGVGDVPGRSVNRLLKVNDPVGDGGCTTLSRSHRRSAPILIVCRPFSQVSESAISVTLVLKSDAVFGGDPSC